MESKTQISLPKGIWEIMDKDLAWLGNTESEGIQNIVISSVFLKNYDQDSVKHELQRIKDHIDVMGNVVSTINDLHNSWRYRTYEKNHE
jgi:hypothetical protein